MSKAQAPSRGDKVTIPFGMITIPVQVFSGIDENATKITRNQFGPSGEKVAYHKVDTGTGEELSQDQITLKYTTADGTLVELSDDEVAAAMGVENGDSELVGIFPNKDFRGNVAGPVQIRPQTQKVGSKTTHPFDKAFALFMGALHDTDSVAVVRYVTRGKPKLLAFDGFGWAVLLHWSNEVRDAAPEPVVEVSEAERELAKKLIGQLTTPVPDEGLEFENEAVEAVRTYAEAKAAGTTPIGEAKPKTTTSADDLMKLLEASVA